MIYITYKYEDHSSMSVNNVWEVDSKEDVYFLYKQHMINIAKNDFNIIINSHWLNIMDIKHNNIHLSKKEFKIKEKMWNKYLLKHDIDYYILEVLNGKKLEYQNLHL